MTLTSAAVEAGLLRKPWCSGPVVKHRSRGKFDAYGDGTWWMNHVCMHCGGRAYCHCLHAPDPEWCCECGGAPEHLVLTLPPGATVRLGHMLAIALSEPPKKRRKRRKAKR